MSADAVTDADRYPVLSPAGREMLLFLREHPCAPIYRNESGHRLTPTDLALVRAREREVLDGEVAWTVDTPPSWVAGHVAHCYAQVPHWRALGDAPARLRDVPTSSRADLSRDIARFVPDDAPLDRLINFRTSGTSGHPLLIASHPVVAASYLAYHKRALRRFGIELRHGRGQVGVVLIGLQRSCFTYVSVTPTMDESGLAKINLHPGDWRRVADRAPYLDALAAEVWTGDPISFAELLRLPLTSAPRAMLSTSMALLPGLRDALRERFGCPVLDIYSLNEAGPVAVHDPQLGGHALLQPRLYVEVLDPAGQPVRPGERGEVTLTGGFNFCLPLLRYRTGDYAAMRWRGREPWLEGLSGRPPVRFLSSAGEWLNNIEVTHALKPLALAQWSLHQAADRSLTLRVDGSAGALAGAEAALRTLFGGGLPLRVELLPPHVDKLVQYTSDLVGAAPGSTA